ncbi:MAG: hypothetical protein ABIS08_11690 [Pseudolysinimonas sp.]
MDDIDTAEPDDLARLLAQLHGTPTPEPADAAPAPAAEQPAPVFTPPPAPVMPAPAMPTPAMPTPAMPAPAMQAPAMPAPAAQTPLAPAFGVSAPYPTLAPLPTAAPDAPAGVPPSIAFPVVAPLSAPTAPVAPPLPRAPEMMGADELAAPPRSFPPLHDPVPPLVDPPELGSAPDADPVFDPQGSYAPPQVYAPEPEPSAPLASGLAPSASMPFTPMPSAPAPSAPASASPSQVSPAPAAATSGAAAASTTGRAPLDFSSLLATPVGADSDQRSAGAPLSIGSAAPDDDESDLGRSTAAERIGLALAVLVAPIGLIVGIVAAVRSAHRRGWVVGIVRASIGIAAVLTVVIAIGGYFEYTQIKKQQEHDQTVAASAAFCAALKADPSLYQPPTFGWPAVAATIPDSLKAMQAYEDRWTKIAQVSPAGIKADATKVAVAAKKIIDSVTTSRTIDDASNVSAMSSIVAASGIPAWHSEYCG